MYHLCYSFTISATLPLRYKYLCFILLLQLHSYFTLEVNLLLWYISFATSVWKYNFLGTGYSDWTLYTVPYTGCTCMCFRMREAMYLNSDVWTLVLKKKVQKTRRNTLQIRTSFKSQAYNSTSISLCIISLV